MNNPCGQCGGWNTHQPDCTSSGAKIMRLGERVLELEAEVSKQRGQIFDMVEERTAQRAELTRLVDIESRLHQMTQRAARLKEALEAVNCIMWMAEGYAEAGGSGGPEMRDYTEAAETLRAALKETP